MSIFVSIASYRDDVCSSTLLDLYNKSDDPEHVFVGICQQNDAKDPDCIPKEFKYKNNVRIIRLKNIEAKGPTYARYLCSKLYENETYFMQIDSHSTFVKGWDTKCKDMIDLLKSSGVEKPVLSYYPLSHVNKDNTTKVPRICEAFFNNENIISFKGGNLLEPTKTPHPSAFITGGFFFCNATFLNELPFDPNLDFLFTGEEILHTIRFYTHGWDAFTPRENILFHEYTRKDKPKFWKDMKYSSENAKKKVKTLLKLIDTHLDDLKNYAYGLGTKRTLEDYYKFAGIDVKNKKITKNFCK